jgi:hypothetical protein
MRAIADERRAARSWDRRAATNPKTEGENAAPGRCLRIRDRDRAESRGPIDGLHFEHGSSFDEQYAPNSFDAIVVSAVLNVVKNRRAVLHCIVELLEPRGWLIAATPAWPTTSRS